MINLFPSATYYHFTQNFIQPVFCCRLLKMLRFGQASLLVSLAAFLSITTGMEIGFQTKKFDIVLVYDFSDSVREPTNLNNVKPRFYDMTAGVLNWLTKEFSYDPHSSERTRFAIITSFAGYIHLKFSDSSWHEVPDTFTRLWSGWKGADNNLRLWATNVLQQIFGETNGDRPDAPNVLFCKFIFLSYIYNSCLVFTHRI